MNVVVANVKGGVGRTTTAVYLSAAAVASGYDPVLLIDADRQASSAEWLEESPLEGVTVVEAPSERTLTRAMSSREGLGVVDTPPGDERLVRSAIGQADAVVFPTRAGGVEFSRVLVTLEMIPTRTPRGIVICAARLGTNDLDEAIAWWKEEKVPIWGVVPERVGIAAGPEARLGRPGAIQHGSAACAATKTLRATASGALAFARWRASFGVSVALRPESPTQAHQRSNEGRPAPSYPWLQGHTSTASLPREALLVGG